RESHGAPSREYKTWAFGLRQRRRGKRLGPAPGRNRLETPGIESGPNPIELIAKFSNPRLGRRSGDGHKQHFRLELWDQLRHELRELRHELWNQLRHELWNQLRHELWNQLRHELWNQLRHELWNQLRHELWNQLRHELWNQL